jgi:protein-S-isoprenylcysteine O-methyltransferase Ste14
MKFLRGILFRLSTVFINLLIPLLGWGLDDLADFFSFGPRAAYAIAVGCFGLVVGIQAIDAPEGIRGSRGEEGKLVRRESVIRVVMVLVLYAAIFLLPFADRRNILVFVASPAACWVGAILCGVGYGLIFWSGLALGKQYSQEVTVQKNHQLITIGIYRYIRNPRYLGLICAAFGMLLLFHSWIGVFLCLVLVPVLMVRIRDEELLLRGEFGAEWESYQKRSWRLLPFVH